ncbi:(2Fe-2S)-binding protein [Burkholderia multivorans]|uniref:(2Fe-2S)-binding protein n=1 Tax=Burkholderia multivorans TaxID=87883 RepID=UPI00075552EE|nr:(2Fe-2S)-binding protein [Burkholderia multivorans]KVS10440.1 sarcosine oxidase [Burkholderia multivorans]MDN8104214.1 (2Fe-2S)-binding protein [Burkholderia multivorans]
MFRISAKAVVPRERRTVTFMFEERTVSAFEGQTVAQALVAANRGACRTTPVSGSARAPYCLMGVCFDCVVEIDGKQNQQGCVVPVRDGMRVRIQHGGRLLSVDADANTEIAGER